jgi:hypothetical protein
MVVPNLAINKIWKYLNFKHRTSALLGYLLEPHVQSEEFLKRKSLE